ncbi:MAG TPA: right-handed parallel beta-helix repeat-containing protein [Acidobacteriota bacterium]|nr:right-handed parallel beta-helix repeat-containing protein [Acidobacteriota bacterium]
MTSNLLKRVRFLVFLGVSACLCISATQAEIRYVSPSGSNTTGDGSIDNPWQTINYGLQNIAAGDTLTIRGGTYAEKIGIGAIPSGTSEDARTVLQNYSGEKVIIQPPTGTGPGVVFLGREKYVTIRGDAPYNVVLDADNIGGAALYLGTGNAISDSATYIRIENVEIKNAVSSGVLRGHLNEFISAWVHHNGSDSGDHGIYVGGSDSLIENCVINNNAAFGIHNYHGPGNQGGVMASRNIYRNNRCYDNARSGIIISHGVNNQVYNNLCYGNGHYGILVQYGRATDTEVYNNTAYDNRLGGIVVGSSAGEGTIVRNNIAYGNGGDQFSAAVEVTEDHNLFGVDPLFVSTDPANPDFMKISADSPAKDAGTSVGSIATLVTSDFWYDERPQGAGLQGLKMRANPPNDDHPHGMWYDIGADEYAEIDAPASLTATVLSPTQVDLAWTNVDRETRYRLERRTGDGAFEPLAVTTANRTSYSDTAVAAGTTYSYRVRAERPQGSSAWTVSNVVTTSF